MTNISSNETIEPGSNHGTMAAAVFDDVVVEATVGGDR